VLKTQKPEGESVEGKARGFRSTLSPYIRFFGFSLLPWLWLDALPTYCASLVCSFMLVS